MCFLQTPLLDLDDNERAYYVLNGTGMDSNFAFDVSETAQALRRAFDRRASALGVTRAQWRALARLSRQDGMRQVELAEALDIEPITLCRMVDRLEEAGLVERRADEKDRRAWRLHLTTAAGPIIERLKALADAFLADALEGVSEAEQAAVRNILARVRTNVAAGAAGKRRA
jgi:DNA-binding MarR family transcriptional regulator